MLVSLMAMTLCASSDSIAASIENFHQGANIRRIRGRLEERRALQAIAVSGSLPQVTSFSPARWFAGSNLVPARVVA
jgi:hypothetical protein